MSAIFIGSVSTAPPKKPVPRARTRDRELKYYTLHTNQNNAFTLIMNDTSRTGIVGFKEWDDAMLIGRMLETHYVRQLEWPDTKIEGQLTLPAAMGPPDVLRHLYIQTWQFDELKLLCTSNVLDMISVDGIASKKSGYSFEGSVFRFEAPPDFYKLRFNELMEKE